MTSSPQVARRKFFRRFGATAASMSAMMGALVPELSRAAGPAPTTAPEGTTTPPPPDVQTQTLPTETQNALYASAIGDPDVAAVIALLGQPLRVDPPVASYASAFSTGEQLASVVLPLVSYASGQAAAYLYFGTTSVGDPGGAQITLPVRLAVCSDGLLRVGMAGSAQVAPAGSASPGVDALFATYFPDEYIASVERANPLPTTPTAGSGLHRAFLRKVMYADGDGALAACRNAYRICLRGATYACATAAIGAVVCTVVLIAGCAPQPLWGATCYGASLFCTGVLIAATVCGLQMTYCRNDFLLCRSKIGQTTT